MKHLLIAAAFAASTTSPTVMAAVYASASLSNIQFKVVDLDLTDGIDASVAFAPFYTALFADNSSGSDFDFETPLNSLTSVSVNNGVITASASSLYGADYGLNLQASGSLTGKINFDYNVFQSFTSDYQQFTLSPMTRLEVTADSNMFVSTNDIFEYSYASHYFYATDSFFNQYTSNGGNIRTQILVDYNNPKFLSEVKSLSYFIENLTIRA